MPLVRISMLEGMPADYRRKVSDAVHQALVDTINVPQKDRFHLVTEHAPSEFLYDDEYLGIKRSDNLVIVQATISEGRSLEMKRALFKRIASNLVEAVGLSPEDVWINLVEVTKENWSFGNGLASYAPEAVPAERKAVA